MPSLLPLRRTLTAALALLVLTAGAGAAAVAVAPAAAAEASSENELLTALNNERTARGLPALRPMSDLISVARKHSGAMAASNTLYHNPNLAKEVTNWVSLAENVGYASTASSLHKALMNSAGHRANILSGTVTEIGVGTVRDGSGRLWATQVFRKPATVTTTSGPSLTTNRAPVGSYDLARQVYGHVRVAGWALDQDTTKSIDVHVYVDGRPYRSVRADANRPDIGRIFGLGSAHGYSTDLLLVEGWRTICVYAINAAGTGGSHRHLGCKKVLVRHTARGSLDSVSAVPGGIVVRGWALDPDGARAIHVHTYVDGRLAKGFPAYDPRGDIDRLFPGYGPHHGYAREISVSRGTHTVCTYAINAWGTPGGNPRLGCRTVTV